MLVQEYLTQVPFLTCSIRKAYRTRAEVCVAPFSLPDNAEMWSCNLQSNIEKKQGGNAVCLLVLILPEATSGFAVKISILVVKS